MIVETERYLTLLHAAGTSCNQTQHHLWVYLPVHLSVLVMGINFHYILWQNRRSCLKKGCYKHHNTEGAKLNFDLITKIGLHIVSPEQWNWTFFFSQQTIWLFHFCGYHYTCRNKKNKVLMIVLERIFMCLRSALRHYDVLLKNFRFFDLDYLRYVVFVLQKRQISS